MNCKNCFIHQKSGQCQKFCDTRSKVVIKEKRSAWKFDNSGGKCVCLIQIDGCIISGSTLRCDYLFLVCDGVEKNAFFVELKGKNLEHALEQVLETIRTLKGNLTGFCLYARVAVTRVPKIVSEQAKNNKKAIERLFNQAGCSGKNLIYQNSNTLETV